MASTPPVIAHAPYSHTGSARAALGGILCGLVAGAHVAWAIARWHFAVEVQWCAYAAALAAFHAGEYLLIAACQPSQVSFDSFLFNHSRAYSTALLAGWAEFWLEAALVPSWKGRGPVAALGLAMVLCGQALRATAMLTAGPSFAHLVATRKRPEHVLVVNGVYSVVRHPAYASWMCWSVGTQVLLCNPLCAVAYASAAWAFFADRVPAEEEALLGFFGADYARYARRTVSGVPGVPGLLVSDEQAEEMRRRFEAEAGGEWRAAE